MKDDVISKQAAIDAVLHCSIVDVKNLLIDRYDAITNLMMLPSAQPERKKGRWIVDPHTQDGYCSECKCDMPVMMEDWQYKSVATLYCPNCGAKMGGEQK